MFPQLGLVTCLEVEGAGMIWLLDHFADGFSVEMRHEWVKYKNDAGHSPHGISSVKLHCWKYFGMTDSLDDPFALASLCESAGNEAIEQRRQKLTNSFAIADVQAATWQVTAIPLKINSAWNPNLNVFFHCNVPIDSHAHVLYSAVSCFEITHMYQWPGHHVFEGCLLVACRPWLKNGVNTPRRPIRTYPSLFTPILFSDFYHHMISTAIRSHQCRFFFEHSSLLWSFNLTHVFFCRQFDWRAFFNEYRF